MTRYKFEEILTRLERHHRAECCATFALGLAWGALLVFILHAWLQF